MTKTRLAMFVAIIAAGLAQYGPSAMGSGFTRTPSGLDGYLVFTADGVFDPVDPGYLPPDGDYFDEVIMGRDESEKEARRAEAVRFFHERLPEHPGTGFVRRV